MITLTLLRADKEAEKRIRFPKDFPETIGDTEILWIDSFNPGNDEIRDLQKRFGLDEYAVEDVIVGNQRPKIEQYENNNFSVIHIPIRSKVENEWFDIEELYVFFEKRWIITIHKEVSDTVQSVVKRISTRGLTPLTKSPSTDLLYYIFFDFAVDTFYPMLDLIGEELETLDKFIVEISESGGLRIGKIGQTMSTVSNIRSEMMFLRGTLAPTRDMLSMIMRGAVPFIANTSLRNFRDIYDHTFQLIETIDSFMDKTNDVRGMYMSLLSASTDKIIKLLAIVSTIFLPLTLLAGVFGMNFTSGYYIPGTHSPLGFYVLIGGMIIIAFILAYLFRRFGWI